MDWLTCIKEAIDYMERDLTEIRGPEEVADAVHISCMYLQRGFQVLTGYSLGEYMRNRKLYLAAVELSDGSISVIETALKYGYETPASFTKAFQRFHGCTPMDVRKGRGSIRTFLRLNISITVQGGNSMQYRLEKKEGFKVVGFCRVFDAEDAYQKIPQFWDEMTSRYCSHLMQQLPPEGDMERYIAAHHIGELGVCMDDLGKSGSFSYLIAGYACGDSVPEGMVTREIAAEEWAVFDCTMADLQQTNTAIWKEWLPGKAEYELAGMYNIEWYSPEGTPGPNQKCQIWIPVRRK